MDTSDLSVKMKDFEHINRNYLMKKCPVIIRLNIPVIIRL